MNSRSASFGIGPIDWKTIEDYCDRIGVDDDQREAMHHHIRAMDDAFVEFKSRKK